MLHSLLNLIFIVLFDIYDQDKDGFITEDELYFMMKKMVNNDISVNQLREIVQKTIQESDLVNKFLNFNL